MLFLLSIVGHGYVVAGMASDTGMSMPAVSADMTMHDDGMDCGTDADCAKDMRMHMACFAHCAVLAGILTEPVSLPIVLATRTVPLSPADPLASVHGPPDPHPPKSV
jgi:hypothetical protein